jgi:hypothetical protein
VSITSLQIEARVQEVFRVREMFWDSGELSVDPRDSNREDQTYNELFQFFVPPLPRNLTLLPDSPVEPDVVQLSNPFTG